MKQLFYSALFSFFSYFSEFIVIFSKILICIKILRLCIVFFFFFGTDMKLFCMKQSLEQRDITDFFNNVRALIEFVWSLKEDRTWYVLVFLK